MPSKEHQYLELSESILLSLELAQGGMAKFFETGENVKLLYAKIKAGPIIPCGTGKDEQRTIEIRTAIENPFCISEPREVLVTCELKRESRHGGWYNSLVEVKVKNSCGIYCFNNSPNASYNPSPQLDRRSTDLHTLTKPVIEFITKKKHCLHNITAADTPPGLDPEDAMLPCDKDPECPERILNKKTG